MTAQLLGEEPPMANSNDIKRLVEESTMDLGDLLECDDMAGPCREVSVDRERGRVVLLVDRRELMSQTLEAFGNQEVSLEWIDGIMAVWRAGRIDELRQRLGLPPGDEQ
jgi:hypothetical protein